MKSQVRIDVNKFNELYVFSDSIYEANGDADTVDVVFKFPTGEQFNIISQPFSVFVIIYDSIHLTGLQAEKIVQTEIPSPIQHPTFHKYP